MEFLIKLPAAAYARKGRLKPALNTWLGARDLGRYLLRKGEDGGDDLAGFDHDVAIHEIADLVLVPGEYEANANGEIVELVPPVMGGPHLMIKLLRPAARAAMTKQRTKMAVIDRDGVETAPAEYDLPAGFEVVKNPGTITWL
jgi:hypothetical protein